jgi:23S rRNA pseudouridine2605 synthase
LAARLMHPRHGIERVYEARVIGVPDPHTIERLRRGVVIDGRPTAPAVVKLMAAASHRRAADAVLMITLREGRNRQVRRMCEAVGHPVVKLRRVRLGPIADPALKVGVYRELRADEVRRLKSAAGLPSTT